MNELIELPEPIRTAENLPTLPAVAIGVLRISRTPDASIGDVAKLISTDPSLAAKLMRVANSPRYRRGNDLTSLEQAAGVLGMRAINLLALSFSLCSSLPRSGDAKAFDYEHYWQRSITSAVAARSLARLVKTPYNDEAFLCGLLARLGQLVMATSIKETYGKVCENSRSRLPTALEESTALGYDFHQIGAALLKSWTMPELVVGTISSWEGDLTHIQADEVVLYRFVQTGDAAAALICEKPAAQNLAHFHDRMLSNFGLTQEEADEFISSLQEDVAETAAALDIATEGLDYASIVQEAQQQALRLGMEALADLEETNDRVEQLEHRNASLDIAANTDKLTQLPNRAAFDERLQNVVSARLCSKSTSHLGLLFMDIDHFKKFNDTYGHSAGDTVLRSVASRLVSSTRETDAIARYGGEEFVAILPNTTLSDLQSVAERLRSQIETETVEIDGKQLRVTISVGGACVPQVASVADATALLEIADGCLYEAKNAGRNRCKCREVGAIAAASKESVLASP